MIQQYAIALVVLLTTSITVMGGAAESAVPPAEVPVPTPAQNADHFDAFYLDGKHVGFHHVRLRALPDAKTVRVSLHTMFLFDPADPSSANENNFAYEFTHQPGQPAQWQSVRYIGRSGEWIVYTRKGNDLVNSEGDRVLELPAVCYPSAAYQLVIDRLELRPGASVAYSLLNEGMLKLEGETLRVVGQEPVALMDGTKATLWRFEEATDAGKVRRVFWLDDQRNLRVTNWNGPRSYRVESGADARAGLPKDWPSLPLGE